MAYMELFKNRMKVRGVELPQRIRANSDLIMEGDWYHDPQTRTVRLFRHKPNSYGFEYEDVAIEDAKYIHKNVQEAVTQQAEYYLQFKPDRDYDIGLYVEITNEHGKTQTWLICQKANDMQFVRYNILPCNYLFKWVNKNHIYQSLGVLRTINSYSSGMLNKASTVYILDDRNSMWIPTDDVAMNFYYDKRIIVSNDQRHVPFVWRATKIEEIAVEGLTKITLTQDKYDAATDYHPKYGHIADINIDVVVDNQPVAVTDDKITATVRSKRKNGEGNYTYSEIADHKFSFGSVGKFVASFNDPDTTWIIEGVESSDYTDYSVVNGELSFKLNRDYNLGGKRIVITATASDGRSTSLELEVVVK